MATRDQKGRFLPGHPGNPTGASPRKGKSLSQILDAAITQKDTRELAKQLVAILLSSPDPGTRTWKDWFALVQWIFDRIDGPVRASGEGEWPVGPTTIIFPERLQGDAEPMRDEDED